MKIPQCDGTYSCERAKYLYVRNLIFSDENEECLHIKPKKYGGQDLMCNLRVTQSIVEDRYE